MGSQQSRAMAGSSLGSLLGLFLGAIVIGGCVFFRLNPFGRDELGIGQASTIGVAVVGGLAAVVVGGMIGAGLATRDNSGKFSARASGDSPATNEKASDHKSNP
jgi:hypothetical protein